MTTTKNRTAIISTTANDATLIAQAAARLAMENGATPEEARDAYAAAYATTCEVNGDVAPSTGAHRGGKRRGFLTRFTGVVMLATTVAAVVLSATAAQGMEAHGAARWDKPVLTVRVANTEAWAGTDVAAALAEWSPAMPMTLTDDPDADVTLTLAAGATLEGATAYRDGAGAHITSCRVELAPKYAGTDNIATLVHELGHCLGLRHNNGGESSVMYWIEGGQHWSNTVTPADLDAVHNLHR